MLPAESDLDAIEYRSASPLAAQPSREFLPKNAILKSVIKRSSLPKLTTKKKESKKGLSDQAYMPTEATFDPYTDAQQEIRVQNI